MIDPETFRLWQQRQVCHQRLRALSNREAHLKFMEEHGAQPQPRIVGFNDFPEEVP